MSRPIHAAIRYYAAAGRRRYLLCRLGDIDAFRRAERDGRIAYHDVWSDRMVTCRNCLRVINTWPPLREKWARRIEEATP